MHLVVAGGGADLAQPLIRKYLDSGWNVTAVCRSRVPGGSSRLTVIPGVDLTTDAVGVVGELPDVDGLVVMPGTSQSCRLEKMTLGGLRSALNDNLLASANALRCGLPRVRDGGSIVVVGSIVGSTGGFGCSGYAAAKAGLVGLVRAAANEVAARDVKVNLLELGFIDTGMGAKLGAAVRERVLPTIPLGRFGTADDFVDAVEYLMTTKYMTGGTLTLAGGLR